MALIALLAAGLAVLGLLSVFAIELSDTQAKSKHDVEARIHERGVLAAALIDSLFGSVAQQIPQAARNYGGRVVSQKALDHQAAQGAEHLPGGARRCTGSRRCLAGLTTGRRWRRWSS